MGVPQGSTPYNQLVVDNNIISINLAANCNQLSELAANTIAGLNASLAAVTSQYNAVVATLSQTETDALNLYNQIAITAGWQTSQAALNTQLATAASLSIDPAGIVAYLKLQATAMIGVNNACLATIIKQLLALNSAYQTLQNDITRLTHQSNALETQLSAIPESITSVTNAALAAAEKFPNCHIPMPPA
jgi:hypothetical protein